MQSKKLFIPIAEVGLDKYLDNTVAEHNGFGHEQFVEMVKQEVNKTNIARAFGVDPRTVASWIKILKKGKR